jgi:hypothetical protein
MIHFDRPGDAPNVLVTRGSLQTTTDCDSYDLHTADYHSASRKFEFNSNIYGHVSVKNALIEAQHGKCFACESKVQHIAYGDVEHYRPKGGYRQTEEEALQTPGYYWLAYDWTNLFFACQLCNQRFKKNLFPLQDPTTRVRSHHDIGNIGNEQPLFINPSVEDPEQHISFRKEIPYAINGNVRGDVTIKGLGLDREALNEERRIIYSRLEALYLIAHVLPPSPYTQNARNEIELALQDSARYSNMARAAITAQFS